MKDFEEWISEDFPQNKRQGFTLSEISQAIKGIDLNDPSLGIIDMDTSESKVYLKVDDNISDSVRITGTVDEGTIKLETDSNALFQEVKKNLLKNLEDRVNI